MQKIDQFCNLSLIPSHLHTIWFHDFDNDINGLVNVNYTYNTNVFEKFELKFDFICAPHTWSNQTKEKESFVKPTYAMIIDKW